MKTIQHKNLFHTDLQHENFPIYNTQLRNKDKSYKNSLGIPTCISEYSSKICYYMHEWVLVHLYTERTSASGACRHRSVLREFCKQTNHTFTYIYQTQSTHAHHVYCLRVWIHISDKLTGAAVVEGLGRWRSQGTSSCTTLLVIGIQEQRDDYPLSHIKSKQLLILKCGYLLFNCTVQSLGTLDWTLLKVTALTYMDSSGATIDLEIIPHMNFHRTNFALIVFCCRGPAANITRHWLFDE